MKKQHGHTTAGALQNAGDLVEAQPPNRMAVGAQRDLGQGHIFFPLPFFLYFYRLYIFIPAGTMMVIYFIFLFWKQNNNLVQSAVLGWDFF